MYLDYTYRNWTMYLQYIDRHLLHSFLQSSSRYPCNSKYSILVEVVLHAVMYYVHSLEAPLGIPAGFKGTGKFPGCSLSLLRMSWIAFSRMKLGLT